VGEVRDEDDEDEDGGGGRGGGVRLPRAEDGVRRWGSHVSVGSKAAMTPRAQPAWVYEYEGGAGGAAGGTGTEEVTIIVDPSPVLSSPPLAALVSYSATMSAAEPVHLTVHESEEGEDGQRSISRQQRSASDHT
jgi:hypothetical protein